MTCLDQSPSEDPADSGRRPWLTLAASVTTGLVTTGLATTGNDKTGNDKTGAQEVKPLHISYSATKPNRCNLLRHSSRSRLRFSFAQVGS